MRTGRNTLMTEFFTDFSASMKSSEVPVQPVEGQMPAPVVRSTIARNSVPGAAIAIRTTVAFYSLYILACITLLLYWQFRSGLEKLPHS
jgi:hypothetical protein